jgi:tetratricopeptide (TPR) repeat protein
MKQLTTPGDGMPSADLGAEKFVAAAQRFLLKPRPPTKPLSWFELERLRALAEICALHGEFDEAIALFELEARTAVANRELEKAEREANGESEVVHGTGLAREAAAWLRIGDLHYGRKLWAEAAAAYDEAWRHDRLHSIAPYLKGRTLAAAGRVEAGRELMNLARLLPLADSELRANFCRSLEERGLADVAMEEREKILLFGRYDIDDDHVPDAVQEVAIHVRDTDPLRAAALWRFFVVYLLRAGPMYDPSEVCPEVALRMRRGRALGLLRAGKPDDALAEIRLARAAAPLDSELVETVVPLLDEQGRRADADAVFADTFAVFDQIARDFPKSARYRNEAARLSARCGRRLDEAKTHAEEAVRMAPDHAAYWHTLAEVCFRRGEREKAIEHARRAVELEPANETLKKRLERYAAPR